VFYIGIIAAVFIALTSLGACDTALGPDGSAKQASAADAVDASGLVEVKVALPKTFDESGRSVTNDYVEVYANYYEVIFKVHGSAEYYFASAEEGKEYLSISVKASEKYDILLLAGTKANRVLLATSFVNLADGSGYDISGTGYEVKVGEANVITMAMTKTNITPDPTPDITFAATQATSGTLAVNYSRIDKIATAEVDEPTFAPLLLTVTLGIDKLTDLSNAGGGSFVFASNKAQLAPRYTQDVETFGLVQSVNSTGPGPYTYVFDISTLGTLDLDAKLRLNLVYYAFGDPDSKSSGWNIRNGLDYDVDNNASGGVMVVTFGDGSDVTKTTTIELGW
jgi:hypothetical protein